MRDVAHLGGQVRVFMGHAGAHIEDAEDQLFALVEEASDDDGGASALARVDSVLALFAPMAKTAGELELAVLAALCARMCDILRSVQAEGGLSLTPDVCTALLQGVDACSMVLISLELNGVEAKEAKEVVSELEQLLG